MSLLRAGDTIPSELQAQENRPYFLVPQPWLAKAALIAESWARNHREDLKKIGIELDNLPYWKRYQMQDHEIKHGLPTYKAGEWKNSFLFNTHNESEATEAQNLFASGMMWEMTKNLEGERAALAINIEAKINPKGEVVKCEPKVAKREWPMTIRVLKKGIDGKPVSFVDVVLEKGESNPFENIDWLRIINNDEVYIKGLSEKSKISQTRSLDDWYIESTRNDKFGEYFRPDILIGQNQDDFRLDHMTADRRPLLTIGLEKNAGSTTGVTVGVQTHLPFNGMDMMGMAVEKGNIYSRDAAFEAVVKNPNLAKLIDGSKEGKLILKKYRNEWEQKKSKIIGVNSFLAKRFTNLNPDNVDERTQIERLLTFTSFEEEVMAEFSRLTDAQKVVDSLALPEEMSKLLIELPKKIKEVSGEKVAGIMFLSLAMYLTDHEAQGFAIGPEAMQAIMGELGYAPVGSKALDNIEAAGKIISDENTIKTANKHADMMRAILMVKDSIGKEKRPTQQAERLRKIKVSDENTASKLAADYAAEILAQYSEDLRLSESNNRHVLVDYEINQKGGLVDYLATQAEYFEVLKKSTFTPMMDIEAIKEISDNLLNLSDGDFGFSLNREEMIDVIDRLSALNYDGELKVTMNGVEWGSTDPVVLFERINRIQHAIANATFDKYKREGIQWLLSRKEREIKTVDELAVERLTSELTAQAGVLSLFAREISDNPDKSIASIKVRSGILSKLEFLLNYGASGLLADMRPSQNASKIVVKAPEGFELIFETALDANHTTVGVGQVNETINRKESTDNPRAMMEVILPYLRGNHNLRREFSLYLEKDNATQSEIDLLTEMLYGEGYECFLDQVRDGMDVSSVDAIELWGSDYIKKKNNGARDALERSIQQSNARVFIDKFNGFMRKVNEEPYMDNPRNTEELQWFMSGGFNKLWSETNRYKLEQIRVNLAQIALIFGLYVKSNSSSEENERLLLNIRAIQESEVQRLRALKSKLKQVYSREDGGIS